jgi:hypothetical protein
METLPIVKARTKAARAIKPKIEIFKKKVVAVFGIARSRSLAWCYGVIIVSHKD